MTAISRKESKATFPDGVKVVRSDFSPSELADAFSSQDVVISAVSTMGENQEIKFIDAALKAGVKRYISNDVSPVHLLCSKRSEARLTSS